MSEIANELRGEVDVELEGERFVLRPSYEAVVACERLTGKGLLALATAAADSEMSAGDAAIVTTELIKSWAKAEGNVQLQTINATRIGELIHEFGLMQVVLRLALALSRAATGGCKADGSPKAEAVTTTMTTTGTLGESSLESPPPPSTGRQSNSGRRPRTSSGARSKPGS